MKIIDSRNHERKTKLPFMISADFRRYWKAKYNDSYTKKYQKHVACSYGHELLCVNGKYRKP